MCISFCKEKQQQQTLPYVNLQNGTGNAAGVSFPSIFTFCIKIFKITNIMDCLFIIIDMHGCQNYKHVLLASLTTVQRQIDFTSINEKHWRELTQIAYADLIRSNKAYLIKRSFMITLIHKIHSLYAWGFSGGKIFSKFSFRQLTWYVCD